MGPKKKEKSKEEEWLECSLCKKWIATTNADEHFKSCDSDHPSIFKYCLKGKTVKAEDLKDEDGNQAIKGLKSKDSLVWLSVNTMSICGLSIGQNVVVNGKLVKRAWPLKKFPLSYIGLTTASRDELGVQEDSLITVEKLNWNDVVVDSLVLQLKESNSIFEKDEFGLFLASHLDGVFLTVGSPLTIRYFGQVCCCEVVDMTIGRKQVSVVSNSLSPMKLSDEFTTPSEKVELQGDSSMLQSPQLCTSHILSAMSTPNRDSLDKSCVSDVADSPDISSLTESISEMNISRLSSINSPSQQTPVREKYPNLVTPSRIGNDCPQRISDFLSSSNIFGKVISGNSKIVIQSASHSKDEKLSSGNQYSVNDIGGMKELQDMLMKRISQALQPGSFSKCILVQGPPGTGKTSFVHAVTQQLQLCKVYVSGTDIWSKLFGESEANLRKIFSSAQERSPSIIIFDDLHVLCPKRSQNSLGQQEHRILGTLLSLIDGSSTDPASSKIVIIGITNNVDALDPALRRAGRFGCEIEVGVPTSVQRAEILAVILNKIAHNLSDADIKTISHNAHGYVGADLTALVNEAFMHALNKKSEQHPKASVVPSSHLPSSVSITLEDLLHASHKIKPSALREIQLEVPQVHWSDIGGMSEVKMRLKEAVEIPLSYPELYHSLGIEPPKGLLMYGPPGCSKTMIAKAVATECHLNFLAVKGPELFNQYVGESEKNIRQVFRKAKSAAPSVIFFDEIDAIAATRGSSAGGSSGVDDRVLTQLLTEMDGMENLKDVFIMAATNRPDKIDRALLRPGRFDSLIYVPLPDDNTRREILQNKLKKMGVLESVNLEQLVEATLNYSGAEIIQMCQEAALCSLREDIHRRKVQQRHFDQAFTKVLPQIDMELLKIYERFSSGR